MLKFIGRVGLGLLGVVYICSGFALLLLGLPLAALPLEWERFSQWTPVVLLALPVWIGILSAPGCVTAVQRALGGRPGNRWVRWSLWGGMSASAAGLAGGSLLAILIPFALAGVVGSILLLLVLDDIHGRPRALVRRWWLRTLGTSAAAFLVTLWALHARP
jgi:hypothetical protein